MWLVQVAFLATGYRIEVDGDGGLVRELGAGDVIGELGVRTGAARSAGVRARRDAVLCWVAPARVDALLTADPAALRALTRLLATQLQVQTPPREGLTDLPRVVAVLGIRDGAPVQRCADELTRRLEQGLSVLTSRSLSPEQLDRAEPEHDRALLVADDPLEPWHSFCRRQADRVVVVAASSAAPPAALTDGEGCVAYLLFIGPAPEAARLRAWHDAVAPRVSLQASADDVDGALRLIAARLAGRSIGVAVEGGGAWSFSTIRVVEELESAGYVIDRWAGCSVGSIVATLFATGRDAAAVDVRLRRGVRTAHPVQRLPGSHRLADAGPQDRGQPGALLRRHADRAAAPRAQPGHHRPAVAVAGGTPAGIGRGGGPRAGGRLSEREPLPTFREKGMAKPIQASRVRAACTRNTAGPAAHTGVVGWDAERELVRQRAAAALAGTGAALLITGDPGIEKSLLVEQACEELATRRVVRVPADPMRRPRRAWCCGCCGARCSGRVRRPATTRRRPTISSASRAHPWCRCSDRFSA